MLSLCVSTSQFYLNLATISRLSGLDKGCIVADLPESDA